MVMVAAVARGTEAVFTEGDDGGETGGGDRSGGDGFMVLMAVATLSGHTNQENGLIVVASRATAACAQPRECKQQHGDDPGDPRGSPRRRKKWKCPAFSDFC